MMLFAQLVPVFLLDIDPVCSAAFLMLAKLDHGPCRTHPQLDRIEPRRSNMGSVCQWFFTLIGKGENTAAIIPLLRIELTVLRRGFHLF